MTERNTIYWKDKLESLKIAIIITCYNNAQTLSSVIDSIMYYSDNIIIINDRSTDNTKEILKNYTTLKIINHSKHQGKGAALKDGLSLAKEHGLSYAITINSDGQHFAEDIPVFIQTIEESPNALLVGAHNLNSDDSSGRISFTNKFSNFLYKLETGIKLDDTKSGYRLYPLEKLNPHKYYYTTKYEFEQEVIVFMAWKGVEVKNIPIQCFYPKAEDKISLFRKLQNFLRISILNITLLLISLLWIWPRNFFRKLSWKNIKMFIYENIIHTQASNKKITLSVMLGVFMGIVPIWGYQMVLALFFAHILKLNKTIALVASNISLPPMTPFLIYASYYTGCIILGEPVSIGISEISFDNLKHFITPYLIGSISFAFLASISVGCVLSIILLIFRKKKVYE